VVQNMSDPPSTVELRVCSVSDTDVVLQWGIKGKRSARKTLENIVVLLHFHHLEKLYVGIIRK